MKYRISSEMTVDMTIAGISIISAIGLSKYNEIQVSDKDVRFSILALHFWR